MAAKGPPEFPSTDRSADLTAAIEVLLRGKTLSVEETRQAFEAIMSGRAHDGQIGGLLALLASRLPTSDELIGAATVMRSRVERVPARCDADRILDTAGTGGAPKTFNVSTAAAIVAAGAGATVAKHGNRSRTGRGSAEVLKKLGVNVDADPPTQARCLEEAQVCFCFAIHHHPAAKHAMGVRKALGFPTLFNLLGPLTNPAGAARQLMGVYDRAFLRPIAEALATLETTRAMVVHSEDGLDEISLSAPTLIAEVQHGEIREYRLDPAELGLTLVQREHVIASDLDHAATMIEDILEGRDRGPAREMTLLNAAAALVVCDLAADFAEALKLAEEAIETRAAADRLARLVEVSRDCRSEKNR